MRILFITLTEVHADHEPEDSEGYKRHFLRKCDVNR